MPWESNHQWVCKEPSSIKAGSSSFGKGQINTRSWVDFGINQENKIIIWC